MRSILAGYRSLLDHIPPASAALAIEKTEMGFALDALTLALVYFEEANLCIQSGAFLSGGIVGAAMMEALLIAFGMLRKEDVEKTVCFTQKNAKTQKSVFDWLKHSDLGSLLEIAQDLKWFECSGVPETFKTLMSPYLSLADQAELYSSLDGTADLGNKAAAAARTYRNFVHPGRCLRDSVALNPEFGRLGCFYLVLAFAVLFDNNRINSQIRSRNP